MVTRHPDLTQFRWLIPLSGPDYRQAERVVTEFCPPALEAARAAAAIESAYVAKHLETATVWLTLFASLGHCSQVLDAVAPHLAPGSPQPDIVSDAAREELLRPHCDSFRRALDLITRVALDIHTGTDLPGNQRALVAIGTRGRADRALLEPYLRDRSTTFGSLPDPDQFWAVLGCNCLTGQTTDAIHWLYNIVLGFDWDWHLGEQAILRRLGL